MLSNITEVGIPNFRDAGGHRTAGGRHVRRGQLYRSVALSHIEPEAIASLGSLGVQTVLDLRTVAEQERHPDRLPNGASHHSLDVLADSTEADPAALFELLADPPRASAVLAAGEAERFFLSSYRDMVRLPSAQAAYATVYRALAADDGPALVHCTAGKDRTGWAVASLLLFLGVPLQDVMRDYLLSDGEVRQAMAPAADWFAENGGDRTVYEQLMGVRADYLETAIEAMEADYGSVERYVDEGLGLDAATRDALIDRLLEPA